jgi:gas vesicle protein
MNSDEDASTHISRSSGAVWAFVFGAVTGAALAMLFAPESGREMRSRLRAKARDVGDFKAAYIARLQAELENWSARIDALAARLDGIRSDLRAEYEAQLAELRTRRERARVTLDELRTDGGAAWQDLAQGADRAWRELRQAVESAASRFA